MVKLTLSSLCHQFALNLFCKMRKIKKERGRWRWGAEAERNRKGKRESENKRERKRKREEEKGSKEEKWTQVGEAFPPPPPAAGEAGVVKALS